MVILSVRNDTLQKYIDLLHQQAFTGTLVVHFDKGYPEKVTRQETMKPEDMRRAMRKPVFVVKKTEEAPAAVPKGKDDGGDNSQESV